MGVHDLLRRRLAVTCAVTALIIASGAGCSVAEEETGQSESEWNSGRYDAAFGDRVARAALRVDGRPSRNWCLAEVQNSLELAGVRAFPRLPGAVDLDNWLQRNVLAGWGFEKQHRDVGNIPRGSIIAWRPGQCGYHPIFGHIEIAVDGGRACSDYCGAIKRGCGAPNVYVPVGSGGESCGTGTTMGAIDAKYRALGGCGSVVGAPLTDERGTPDGIGRYNVFERGSIYWTAATGAYEVHGIIRDKWKDVGWETGILGYPITDETPTPDGRGRYNVFQRGSIYWTEREGAHEVHGVIRDKWKDVGWEAGVLGYPITDEVATPDGAGRYNVFERGSIYWTEATGAHAVHGRIRDKWKELGWESGALGYPVSDEYATEGGRKNDFQRGSITWNANTDDFTVQMKPDGTDSGDEEPGD